ncbi:MAG: efflux RND transporter periplasmic adaptor subunit [Paludibacteraceae bacterium]|nr:efflux RND transporter periplasmic adaptor subunit [Paludibacteraceae bacterium]
MKKIVLIMSVLALVACGKQSTDNTQEITERKVLVTKTQVCELPFRIPAQLRGKQDIAILPQVSGALVEVLVEEGQRVKKGQPLFRIDATAYQAAYDNARGAVLRAEVAVNTEQLEVEAKKVLLDKNIISEHEYKVQENNLRIAQATLEEAKGALSHAQNDLNHTTVVAPNTGVVGTITYKQGSLVSPDMAQPLTIVSDNSMIYAYASLAEQSYMVLLKEYGSKDSIIAQLPDMHLILAEGSTFPHSGRLETISGVIDKTTGAISIRIAFPNPEGKLSAGGSAQVEFVYSFDGIVIPRKATFDIQDKTYCYVATQQDSVYTVSSKMIDVMRLNETEFAVDGLNDGEVVVIEGVKKLVNGQQIEPIWN